MINVCKELFFRNSFKLISHYQKYKIQFVVPAQLNAWGKDIFKYALKNGRIFRKCLQCKLGKKSDEKQS